MPGARFSGGIATPGSGGSAGTMDGSSSAMVKMVFLRFVLTISRRIYAKSGMKV